MIRNRGIGRSSESGERERREERGSNHTPTTPNMDFLGKEREREQKHISVVKFFVNNQHFQKRSIHQTLHHHRQNTRSKKGLSRGLKREERSSTTNITLSIGCLSGDLLSPFSPTAPLLSIVVFPNICSFMWVNQNATLSPPTFMFCSFENCVKEREEKERGERKRERKGKKMVRSVREEKCV